jgi:hypothetical protein
MSGHLFEVDVSKVRNFLKEALSHEFIYEMANTLERKWTGLPFDIWISQEVYASGKHSRPRLKVLQSDLKASVAIDDPVVVLGIKKGDRFPVRKFNQLRQYIELNRGPLLEFWNEDIDFLQYIEKQRAI